MHEAVSNQRAKKRRQDAAAKAEDDLGAVYEVEPQLPGNQGGAQAILHRLWSESQGRPITAITTSSQESNLNSKGEQLASQKVRDPTSGSEPRRLLSPETVGRIRKGELHAINNILNVKPR